MDFFGPIFGHLLLVSGLQRLLLNKKNFYPFKFFTNQKFGCPWAIPRGLNFKCGFFNLGNSPSHRKKWCKKKQKKKILPWEHPKTSGSQVWGCYGLFGLFLEGFFSPPKNLSGVVFKKKKPWPFVASQGGGGENRLGVLAQLVNSASLDKGFTIQGVPCPGPPRGEPPPAHPVRAIFSFASVFHNTFFAVFTDFHFSIHFVSPPFPPGASPLFFCSFYNRVPPCPPPPISEGLFSPGPRGDHNPHTLEPQAGRAGGLFFFRFAIFQRRFGQPGGPWRGAICSVLGHPHPWNQLSRGRGHVPFGGASPPGEQHRPFSP